MSAFSIKKISEEFESIADAAISGRPTPEARDALRIHTADVRRFLSVLEMNREEVENIMAWKNVRRI